ncbi:MAG: hypothetical protein ACK5QX_01695, partial [bacterium]
QYGFKSGLVRPSDDPVGRDAALKEIRARQYDESSGLLVGTSLEARTAARYAAPRSNSAGWLYVLRRPQETYDFNELQGRYGKDDNGRTIFVVDKTGLPLEFEVGIPYNVGPQDIIGAIRVTRDEDGVQSIGEVRVNPLVETQLGDMLRSPGADGYTTPLVGDTLRSPEIVRGFDELAGNVADALGRGDLGTIQYPQVGAIAKELGLFIPSLGMEGMKDYSLAEQLAVAGALRADGTMPSLELLRQLAAQDRFSTLAGSTTFQSSGGAYSSYAESAVALARSAFLSGFSARDVRSFLGQLRNDFSLKQVIADEISEPGGKTSVAGRDFDSSMAHLSLNTDLLSGGIQTRKGPY